MYYHNMVRQYNKEKKQKKLPVNKMPQKYTPEIEGLMFPGSFMISKDRDPTENLKFNVETDIKKDKKINPSDVFEGINKSQSKKNKQKK